MISLLHWVIFDTLILTGKLLARLAAGTCHKPRLRLGFERHDFGMCFVRSSTAPALECILPVHNSDTFPIDIEKR